MKAITAEVGRSLLTWTGHGPTWQGRQSLTAGLLVIGDEILLGRTKDKNIGYIAGYLTAIGIDLKEVRVIGDQEAAIVEGVNAFAAAIVTCLQLAASARPMMTSQRSASPKRSACDRL